MNTKPKILVRADGNEKIGLGHVYRALALCEIISSEFEIDFFIKTPSLEVIQLIESFGCRVINIPLDLNQKQEVDYLIMNSNDVKAIILDGYQFNSEYQFEIKRSKKILIYLDDLMRGRYFADIIIKPSGGIDNKKYETESYSKIFSGIEYALLRNSFYKKSYERKLNNNLGDEVLKGNCFVSLGGADPAGKTIEVVKFLYKRPEVDILNVVIGSAFNYKDQLNETIKHNPKKVVVHENIDANKLIELMSCAQFGVCSSSTIAYEFLCCNENLFILLTAENQKNAYDFLISKKMAKDFAMFPDINSIDKNLIQNTFNGSQIENFKTIINSVL